MSTAQAGLNATPLATATPSPAASTPTPPPFTPTPSLTPPTNPGGFSPAELFARGEEAARRSDYESAVSWLEALRGLDFSYRRSEVESLLLTAYQALGSQYRFEGRLSEMVVVIRKALRINPLSDTDWAFTIDAAELYLSARGYLDAGNIPLAAQVFRRLMDMARHLLDGYQDAGLPCVLCRRRHGLADPVRVPVSATPCHIPVGTRRPSPALFDQPSPSSDEACLVRLALAQFVNVMNKVLFIG